MREQEIIQAVKAGSKEAIQSVYLTNKDAFTRFVQVKYAVSDTDVEDLYQDAIIALVENIRKGKLDNLVSSLKTYLFSIGKFMAYKNYRQQMRNLATITDEMPEDLEWEDNEEEDNEAVIQLIQSRLNEMGEGCKKVLIMFYLEEKKIEDIVKAGNYAGKDVVKSQKSRCLAQLKKLVYGK